MNPIRTYFLFKNDIRATIEDARSKGKDDAEVDHRLQSVWGMSLAQYMQLSGN